MLRTFYQSSVVKRMELYVQAAGGSDYMDLHRLATENNCSEVADGEMHFLCVCAVRPEAICSSSYAIVRNSN